ncbi:MAG: kelch motif-containing protein, partial [Thermoplasmata archaeon]|nr:kelch motif-containing protein [Thermoplasmata archaeon]
MLTSRTLIVLLLTAVVALPSALVGSPLLGGAHTPAASPTPSSSNQTAWTNLTSLSPTAPSCRGDQATTYDPVHHDVLLFGGLRGCSINQMSLADTWTFANGTWTNITSTSGVAPPPRFWSVLVWDYADGYALLFGGYDLSNGSLGDTWTWNGTWSQVSPSTAPSARYFYSADY